MKNRKEFLTVLLMAVLLFLAALASADVFRYNYRVVSSPVSSARIPQFFIVDTDSEITGITGVADGDLLYLKDLDRLYNRANGVWVVSLTTNVGSCPGTQFSFGVNPSNGTTNCDDVYFSYLVGTATDVQIPNNITIDLATLATTATTANAGDSATAFFPAGTIEDARIDGSAEADELVLAGDVDGAANANDLDEAAVEVELEGVLELQDLQGAVVDTQVPNTITVDLAAVATTANSGDSATGFFPAGVLEVVRGGTGSAPASDDQVLVSDSAAAATWRTVPDCGESGTLNYTQATNTFSCLTDGGGGGGSNVVEVDVDFGVGGNTNVSTVVTGQTWVTSTSKIICSPTMLATTTRDEGAEDVIIEGLTVAAHTRSAGVGFTLSSAVKEGMAYGVFKVHCTGA